MVDISDYTNVNNFISWTQSSQRRIWNIPLLFWDDINSTYKDILNCEIVKKPFRDWRTPDWFFLKKRWWLTVHLDWGWDYVIDYSTFDNAEYAIVKNWSNIEIKKRDGTQFKTLFTQPFNDKVYHSFKKWFSAPSGDVKYSGTVSSVSSTSWVYKITVTWAWWTTNEFAWKFVAITDWPSLWSVYKISANDATSLTLQYGWDTEPTTDSKFKIYSDYTETLSFIGNDWIYSIINDKPLPITTYTPAEVTFTVTANTDITDSHDAGSVSLVEWWNYKNAVNSSTTSVVLVQATAAEYTYNATDFDAYTTLTDGSITTPYSENTPDNDNIYWFKSFGTVVDADWNDWRIFAINLENTVSCSATETNDWQYVMSWGYFAWYINSSSVLGSVRNVLRVVPFNNVLLLFTHDCIYIVKQVNVERQWTTFNTYNVNIGTDYIGLHSATAVKSYNTWLYLLTSKNSLVSLSIEDWYQGKYKISTEDMWLDIQQWLDNIKSTDKVSIWINNDEIDLTWNNWEKTTIFKYSMFYKFWYRWETTLLFSKIYANIDITYIWDRTYRYNNDIENDWAAEWMPINSFEQWLRWMIGEDDIFQLKTILYHKIYLWANTSTNTIVHYKFRVSGETYEYSIPLNTLIYLSKSSSVKDNTTLWESILWFNILGWSLQNKLIWKLVSDVNVIEIPLWLTFTLAEIWMTWDYEVGWHLIWELRHEEQLTPFEDVVPYF